MSLSLTVGDVIEKNKIASDVAYLVLLEIGVIDPDTSSLVETLYVCNNKEDITFNGQLYTAYSLDSNIIQEPGSMPEMTLTINDYANVIQASMQQYNGGVGFAIKLMYVNSSALDDDPEIEENFTVESASAQNYIISFKLGAENPLAKRCPKRLQYRESCSFTYKSTECGYSGALTSCDYTLTGDNGCIFHENAERFGGFPGITG